MPPRLTRTVKLPGRSSYSKARLHLLTYRMALAQPSATVPLLPNQTKPRTGQDVTTAQSLADRLSSLSTRTATASASALDAALGRGRGNAESRLAREEAESAMRFVDDEADAGAALTTSGGRRWVREADELCVASVLRSNNLNRVNTYVVTYKFDDPLWRPFLLPEVHVLPRTAQATAASRATVEGSAVGGGQGRTEEPEPATVRDSDAVAGEEEEKEEEKERPSSEEATEVNGKAKKTKTLLRKRSAAKSVKEAAASSKEAIDASSDAGGGGGGGGAATSSGDGGGGRQSNASIGANRAEGDDEPAYNVFIDYNKATNLELISRHVNYALRHLVQKGHAMYFVFFAQHSILEMRGLVERSYVTCSYGIRGERLRTYITHIGPLDVRDVIEIDPVTHHVTFNLQKSNVRKGVVAVSQVEGYGTWFQRKPMLWQRTRRIGALQSVMGAYQYDLCSPESVGRVRDYEVSLLRPHVRLFNDARDGAEAVALIAASQVAQNNRMYVGQFEAPAMAAIDAVHQLLHRAALSLQLVRPAIPAVTEVAEKAANTHASPSLSSSPSAVTDHTATNPSEEPLTGSRGASGGWGNEMEKLRRVVGMERMLPVSWVTRTPPPYVPLEADLPFKIQLSKPTVLPVPPVSPAASADGVSSPMAYPTGGTVGSPFVKGVPLSLFEYNVHQGVDHYVFDDSPSSRPMKWWNQASNMPYSGYVYCMRSGLLDFVEPAERLVNPLEPPTTTTTTAKQSSARSQRLKRRQRRRLAKLRATHAAMAEADSAQAASRLEEDAALSMMSEQADFEATQTTAGSTHADEQPEAPLFNVETWSGRDTDLEGHDGPSRQHEAHILAEEEVAIAQQQYRPALHRLVPPNATAQARAARYTHAGRVSGGATGEGSGRHATVEEDVEDGATALLHRRLRQRRRRTQRRSANDETAASQKAASDDRLASASERATDHPVGESAASPTTPGARSL